MRDSSRDGVVTLPSCILCGACRLSGREAKSYLGHQQLAPLMQLRHNMSHFLSNLAIFIQVSVGWLGCGVLYCT